MSAKDNIWMADLDEIGSLSYKNLFIMCHRCFY